MNKTITDKLHNNLDYMNYINAVCEIIYPLIEDKDGLSKIADNDIYTKHMILGRSIRNYCLWPNSEHYIVPPLVTIDDNYIELHPDDISMDVVNNLITMAKQDVMKGI